VSTAPNAPAIYFESLDASRFAQPQYLEDLREWLRRKYRDTGIDLVVSVGEDALGFLADSHGEPWPDAQVLYFESGTISVDSRTLPQAGGMLLEDPTSDVLGVVKTILPDRRRMALVYGASAVEIRRYRGLAEEVRSAGFEPIELVGVCRRGAPSGRDRGDRPGAGCRRERERAVAISDLRADRVCRDRPHTHAGSQPSRLWCGRGVDA
jgi:hypothetical protein